MIFQQYIYTTTLAYLHMVVLFDFSVSEDEANRSRKRRLIVKSVDMSKVWNLYCCDIPNICIRGLV